LKLKCFHHRHSLRPDTIANANDQAHFGQLEVQGELNKRAWAKGMHVTCLPAGR